MAVIEDIDGLLLQFNNTFLTKLAKMRFRFEEKGRPTMYRTFGSLLEFNQYFYSTLSDPNLQCLTGRISILESISVKNDKLNFENSYYVRNISNGINVTPDFKYDSFRESKIKNRANVYKEYLLKRFTNYMKDINTLLLSKDQLYIEACYIQPFYFENKFAELLTV